MQIAQLSKEAMKKNPLTFCLSIDESTTPSTALLSPVVGSWANSSFLLQMVTRSWKREKKIEKKKHIRIHDFWGIHLRNREKQESWLTVAKSTTDLVLRVLVQLRRAHCCCVHCPLWSVLLGKENPLAEQLTHFKTLTLIFRSHLKTSLRYHYLKEPIFAFHLSDYRTRARQTTTLQAALAFKNEISLISSLSVRLFAQTIQMHQSCKQFHVH